MTYKGKIDQKIVYESAEGYAKYAPLYKADEPFLNSFDQKLLLRTVRDLKGLKILDAGCGEGRLMNLFKKREADYVIGTDISPDMLSYAEKLHFYKELIVHDVREELPFDWKSLDVIFCTLVLVHIAERDISKVLAEFYRTLMDDGILYLGNIVQRRPPLLTSPEGEKFYIKSFQHADKTVINYLKDVGFENIEVHEQKEEGTHISSIILARK